MLTLNRRVFILRKQKGIVFMLTETMFYLIFINRAGKNLPLLNEFWFVGNCIQYLKIHVTALDSVQLISLFILKFALKQALGMHSNLSWVYGDLT